MLRCSEEKNFEEKKKSKVHSKTRPQTTEQEERDAKENPRRARELMEFYAQRTAAGVLAVSSSVGKAAKIVSLIRHTVRYWKRKLLKPSHQFLARGGKR
jgi:hypothetical protein